MIRATKVSKTYSTAQGELSILSGVSFEIDSDEHLALIGRSGSGKTTLLNILAGLDQASSGSLTVGEQELVGATGPELDIYRRHQVGVIFQQFHLIPHRTAQQNVELPMVFLGESPGKRQEIARECLQQVGLADRLGHYPSQLSGGEQQRVAVARAIATSPTIILADEPTGNLDSENAEQIMGLLKEVATSRRCVLFVVTHDRQLAEAHFQRFLSISDGQLFPSTPFCPSNHK